MDGLLAYAGFSRGEAYITNVVNCRPPGTRLPMPRKAAACRPYLLGQINLIRPKVIVCLGALATQALVGPPARITPTYLLLIFPAGAGVWREVSAALPRK